MSRGGGKPHMPPTPSPTPIPIEITQESRKKAEEERRRLLAKKGRAGTILTGTLGEPIGTGKGTLLGQAI
jgi:hypothetical protein